MNNTTSEFEPIMIHAKYSLLSDSDVRYSYRKVLKIKYLGMCDVLVSDFVRRKFPGKAIPKYDLL